MDRLYIFLVFLLGVASCSQDQSSGSVLEVTVRPGDNITLYCDCNLSVHLGVYIVWYKNCSHENHASDVLRSKYDRMRIPNRPNTGLLQPFHHLQFVRNFSSESYDLLILNITNSDAGLYYCGTERRRVEDKEFIQIRFDSGYGNVTTRILVDSCEPHHYETPQDCNSCWMLLFSLCPTFAVLSSLLSSLLVHHLCQKTAKEPQVDEQTPDTRGQTRLNQGDDVCYAGLEIRQASQRPKKKKTQSSDFSTYSAINTSRM